MIKIYVITVHIQFGNGCAAYLAKLQITFCTHKIPLLMIIFTPWQKFGQRGIVIASAVSFVHPNIIWASTQKLYNAIVSHIYGRST